MQVLRVVRYGRKNSRVLWEDGSTCLLPNDRLNEPGLFAVKVKVKETDLMMQINDCYAALSPENLTCDGEAPLSFVRSRRRKYEEQLRQLFIQIGREVSEMEALDWYMKYRKQI